jgi:nitroimidazol reductase NimA-like FMN-containing flavoprotein (pyridoxamine 5'-phosphate oxidase superfamily)
MTKPDEGGVAVAETLTLDDCFRLLMTQSVGRLAVAMPGEAPLVVPVNYVLDGTVVVFRSDLGDKLALLREQPVAFQIDQIDYFHRTGWSVLVQGPAYEATHFEVEHLMLRPWAEGEKSHWVRVIPSSVTGRRLILPDWDRPQHGYL